MSPLVFPNILVSKATISGLQLPIARSLIAWLGSVGASGALHVAAPRGSRVRASCHACPPWERHKNRFNFDMVNSIIG